MQRKGAGQTSTNNAEESFGKVLRKLRNEQGISQETLAFESGYHPTYISQLERGKKSPSLRTIIRLATVLNICGSEILRHVETDLKQKP